MPHEHYQALFSVNEPLHEVSFPLEDENFTSLSVRALVGKMPTPAEVVESIQNDLPLEMYWVVSQKDETSKSAYKVGLPGGKLTEDDRIAVKEQGDDAFVSAASTLMSDKTNLHDFFLGGQALGRQKYTLPGQDVSPMAIELVSLVSPLHDQPGNVADEEQNILDIHLLTTTQMLSLIEHGWVELEDQRLEAMEYLHKNSGVGTRELIDLAVDHILVMEDLFQTALHNLQEESVRRVGREPAVWVADQLLLLEAKQYLTEYRSDPVRAVPVFMHSLWFGGHNLWPYKDELLSVLDDKAAIEVRSLLALIQSEDNEAFKDYFRSVGWHDVSAHQATREFLDALIGSITSQNSEASWEVSPRNEIIGSSFATLSHIVRTGNKGGKPMSDRVAYDAARYLGIAYTASLLWPSYVEKFRLENTHFDEFITEMFPEVPTLTYDLGFYNRETPVRSYTTRDGKKLAFVADEGETKTMSSFIRKALLLGGKRLNEISDINRMSLVFLGDITASGQLNDAISYHERYQLIERFYDDFSERLYEYGLLMGSKKGEPGKGIRKQFDMLLGGKGQKAARDGSIAHLFAEAKAYVFSGEGSALSEITELAIWATPFESTKALEGIITRHMHVYGYLEKLIDDKSYGMRRLVSIFRYFFSNLLYSPQVYERPFDKKSTTR